LTGLHASTAVVTMPNALSFVRSGAGLRGDPLTVCSVFSVTVAGEGFSADDQAHRIKRETRVIESNNALRTP
jgi:hypothetical protein